MTTDFDKMISLVNSIQAEQKRQSEALVIASKAMEETHEKLNSLVHFIRGAMEVAPIVPNANDTNRVILKQLYEATSILNSAAVDMKFGKL